MDAVRKIIDNATNPLTIELPEEYHNIKVEVIVLPLHESNEPKKKYDSQILLGN